MAGIFKDAAKTLREIYLDEEIVIYLKDMNVVAVNEEGHTMEVTAMTTGYCIDVDQNFFYLGTPDGAITRTISHDVAQMVELVMPHDVDFTFDMPDEGDEVH